MRDVAESCRVALVQAEPVMFDRQAGVAKTLELIGQAAKSRPDLIVFPELFVPGYPIGMTFGFSMGKRSEGGRRDWKRYYDASLVAGGPEFEQLADAVGPCGRTHLLGRATCRSRAWRSTRRA